VRKGGKNKGKRRIAVLHSISMGLEKRKKNGREGRKKKGKNRKKEKEEKKGRNKFLGRCKHVRRSLRTKTEPVVERNRAVFPPNTRRGKSKILESGE